MSKQKFREIHAPTEGGGVQFAASADRWHLHGDHVHLAPHHREGGLLRFEANLMPFVDNPERQALVVIDMQNGFCSPGGWTDASGQDLERGPVLTAGPWGARMVDELLPLMREDDIHVEKVRMNGLFGTHLDQVLRTQGTETLFFAGVNIDQCVTSTMEEAYFRDHNAVLLEDAAATSSPDCGYEAGVFNARHCWGFSMTTGQLAGAQPFGGGES